MRRLTGIICVVLIIGAIYFVGGGDVASLMDGCTGCTGGTGLFSPQEAQYYLQIGNDELEYENKECVMVNFMITDTGAISNSVPVGSYLDGYKPCRVNPEDPNQIISGWTEQKGGTIPFTGKAAEGLTLYPIWSDCTVYSDRTPVGYWDNNDTSKSYNPWTNEQADQWTSYENKPKFYQYQLEGSSCILVDFREGYKETDVIEITVEMSVNKLYLIGVQDKTFETKINVNSRSTELHIYMSNMHMESRKGSPVIDTEKVNFEVVTIEASGNCSLTGNESSAISGDVIAITGGNGSYTIKGGNSTEEEVFSGIKCNRVNINNTKVIVEGGTGANGKNGHSQGDGTHGTPGDTGGQGGHAISVNNKMELYRCTLSLKGGKGGTGGTGGRGDNADVGFALSPKNGGNGGNGGKGGDMISGFAEYDVTVLLNRDDVFISGNGGAGGDGGEGGAPGGSVNKGSPGAKGSTGATGLVAKLIKK